MAFLSERWVIARLVARCSKRPVDRAAWEEFVRRFHPTIKACVSQVLSYKSSNGSAHSLDCSDAVIGTLIESVYTRLTENRSQALKSVRVRRPESMHTFLSMISVNVVRDYVREAGAGIKTR